MNPKVLLYDEVASFDVPNTIPSDAHHVASLEWSSSPINYMLNRYMISLDKSGNYWLLWIKADDNEDDSVDQLVAYGQKTIEDIKEAAIRLLKAYWITYFKEYENPDSNYKIIEAGILNGEDLYEIRDELNFN